MLGFTLTSSWLFVLTLTTYCVITGFTICCGPCKCLKILLLHIKHSDSVLSFFVPGLCSRLWCQKTVPWGISTHGILPTGRCTLANDNIARAPWGFCQDTWCALGRGQTGRWAVSSFFWETTSSGKPSCLIRVQHFSFLSYWLILR